MICISSIPPPIYIITIMSPSIVLFKWHRLIISKQKSEQFPKFCLEGVIYLRIEYTKNLA